MKFPPFFYHRPTSVTEAVALLAEHGADAKVLAGGQSLLPVMALRLGQPDHLVDIGRIESLCHIEVTASGLRTAITTIEGLAGPDGKLSPLQQSFMDHHGFQCAFCAPGFILTAQTMLDDGKQRDRDHLRAELSGNLCRCTGYQSNLASVEAAMNAAGAASEGGA